MESGQTGTAQPLGVGAILDAAFRLYAGQAVNLWKIVALIVIPVQVIDRLVFATSLPSGVFAHDGTLYTSSAQTSTGGAPVIVTIVLGVVSAALAIGALSRLLLGAYTDRPTDWRTSLKFATDRLGPLLWLSLLTGALVIVGFILIIIPGIYLLVSLSVAVPVLMFEGIGGPGAVSRSRRLVSGRWWATFGALFVGVVLIVVVELAIGALVGAIASGVHVDSVGLTEVLGGVGAALATILTYPLFAAIAAVIYIDLRVRKESLDVHHLAQGFDASETMK
jgi:hypothetical protein